VLSTFCAEGDPAKLKLILTRLRKIKFDLIPANAHELRRIANVQPISKPTVDA
jgi:hypothetical protein